MRATRHVLAAIAILLAACGTDADAGSSEPSAEPAETTAGIGPGLSPSNVATTVPDTAPTDLPPPDLAVFIAAVNEALEGTSYQDAALSDPEVFIGVGQLFCELLDAGGTVDGVLGDYLDALADGESGVAGDDDVLAAGVLMGASIEVLCPAHAPGGDAS